MPTERTRTLSRTRKSSRGPSKEAPKNQVIQGDGQAPAGFLLVNMIPKSLSGESHQDSEPHLTVNSANAAQIIGSAFSPNPGGGSKAPVYTSLDGGNTWRLNAIVPSVPGSTLGTSDITTCFNRTGSTLYAGILFGGDGRMLFLRTTSPFSPTVMTLLKSRPNADQPFTHATTVPSGPDAGKDRVYIGNNDFAATGGRTETVDTSLSAGVPAPAFTSVRIEKRSTVGQDGPQSRPVAHPDGTVYAAFYRWRSQTGSFPANTLVITSADVVVVRDDQGGAAGFTNLVEPPAPAGDTRVGKRVVQGISFPFMLQGTPATGQQRIGGTISIAVDPKNSSTVYLAWGDAQPGSFLTIHVRRSTDRGLTWSPNDLLTIPNATNAALAIAEIVPIIDPGRRRKSRRRTKAVVPPIPSKQVIGLLCQQVIGTGAAARWVTHLRRSPDGVNWSDLILAHTPAATPAKTFDPYLGDYDHLIAVQNVFFGIFSANNTPNVFNFPNGVKYQRNADFSTRTLLNVDNHTPVAVSIDPFFFRLPN
jgi:hypothetical protein